MLPLSPSIITKIPFTIFITPTKVNNEPIFTSIILLNISEAAPNIDAVYEIPKNLFLLNTKDIENNINITIPTFLLKTTPKEFKIRLVIAPATIPNTICDKVSSKAEFMESPITIFCIIVNFLLLKNNIIPIKISKLIKSGSTIMDATDSKVNKNKFINWISPCYLSSSFKISNALFIWESFSFVYSSLSSSSFNSTS